MIDVEAIRKRNEERRKLRDAATPGPWRATFDTEKPSSRLSAISVPHPNTEFGSKALVMFPNWNFRNGELWNAWITCKSEDVAFIAAARTDTAHEDIDALLAEIQRLTKGDRP